ncbi:unnamed protein product [Absidia cylindrospora]
MDEVMGGDSDFDFTSSSSVSDNDDGYGMSFIGDSVTERKSYQVDFTVQSVKDLVASQAKEIDQVTTVLGKSGVSSKEAAALLRYFRWNKEKLFEGFMESSENVLRLAGVCVNNNNNNNKQTLLFPHQLDADDLPFCCQICFDDDEDVMTAGALCGHRYCVDCYRYYLTQKINQEGNSQHIQCPHEKCTVLVDETTIQQVLAYGDQTAVKDGEKTMAKYRQLLNKAFVDDNDQLRWCPAPDCDYAVECQIPSTSLMTIVPTVQCACNDLFCFGCGLADHQPAVCSMVKSWVEKSKDDSKTAQWMVNNTKGCPKCSAIIEKNGGCNYMRCSKCHYSFCWVCLHSLETSHHCNRFHGEEVSDSENARQKNAHYLKRYLHYYERYHNHEKSAKLDQELYEKTELKMEEMQHRSDLSWIEVQFLKTAVDVAVECRTTLKWTYAFAYYLNKTNETDLFEDNQQDLELATEQLSELLEQPFDKEKWPMWRRAVLDKTAYVKGRREVLLGDTAKGLADSRWAFIALN